MLSPAMTQHVLKLKYLVNNNSTTILTAMGVTGTVGTAYLTGRASFKAADILAKENAVINIAVEEEQDPVYLTLKEKTKLVWKLYIPAVAAGATTITSIIVANKISSKQVAALVVASGISERALQDYKAKVVEKLGERQDQKIRDEIAQDRVTAQPLGAREIILAGTGEVLCYDMLTGRYFQSTVEEIKRAENKVNYDLIHFMSASLSSFYDEVGLPATSYTDSVGWNLNNKLEVKFSTTMSSDGRPCIAVDFYNMPIPEYDNVWS